MNACMITYICILLYLTVYVYMGILRYFEIIDTFYRLFMTGFLVLIKQGTVIQTLVGILFTISYIKLYQYIQPYHNTVYGVLKDITQWQIIMILQVALLIQTNAFMEYQYLYSIFVVIIICACLFYDILRLLCILISEYLIINNVIKSPLFSLSSSVKNPISESYEYSNDDRFMSVEKSWNDRNKSCIELSTANSNIF
jgi:hypothetical protein